MALLSLGGREHWHPLRRHAVELLGLIEYGIEDRQAGAMGDDPASVPSTPPLVFPRRPRLWAPCLPPFFEESLVL